MPFHLVTPVVTSSKAEYARNRAKSSWRASSCFSLDSHFRNLFRTRNSC
jgi:hypothetical protein